MKAFRRVVVCAVIALLCRCVALSQSANNPPSNDAGVAWKELLQAASPAGQQQTNESIATRALTVSAKAKAFYIQFPQSTNALAAKILECQMLQAAYEHGDQRVFGQWDNAEANLVPNPDLSASERFNVRPPVIRELIKRYPHKEKPYLMLLDLAAISPDDQAKALLQRLDLMEKPLDIMFTAMDGREVDLGQMKGRVVLIDFWSTTCLPCVLEMPSIKEIYEKDHSHGFDIIGISFDTDEKALTRFVQNHDLPWPQYFMGQDPTNKFGAEFMIENIPTLWLVDKKGILRETDARDDLQTKVEKLLAE
jgi:thiol-disulfide isomerase/thioredoxin